MRRYIIDIRPDANSENDFTFTLLRHGEEVFEVTDAIVPGLETVNKAIMKDLAEDPLD